MRLASHLVTRGAMSAHIDKCCWYCTTKRLAQPHKIYS